MTCFSKDRGHDNEDHISVCKDLFYLSTPELGRGGELVIGVSNTHPGYQFNMKSASVISNFHLENVLFTWLEEVVFLLLSCLPDPLSFHTFCKHLLFCVQEPIEIANCCMHYPNQLKSAKSLPICPPQLQVGCLEERPPLLLP